MLESIKNITFTPRNPILSGFEVKEYSNSKASLTDKIKEYLIQKHRVDFYSFICVTTGEFNINIDFESYNAKANQVIFLAPNKVLEFQSFSTDFKCKWIVFTKEFYKSDFELGKLEIINSHSNTFIINYSRNSEFKINLDSLILEYQSEKDFKVLAIQSLLNLILISAEREIDARSLNHITENKNNKHFETYKNFLELVENNFAIEHQVTFYCKNLALSRSSLQKIIISFTGIAPKQFIINRLVLEAKRELLHSTLSVKEIAFKLGFNEESPFSNFFRKYQMQTPLEFRNDYLQ